MMTLTLSGGEQATLQRIDGLRVSLSSPVAAAPGTPLAVTLPDKRSLRIKVHRCVRDGDAFDISGKLVDATRELREHLVQSLEATGDAT